MILDGDVYTGFVERGHAMDSRTVSREVELDKPREACGVFGIWGHPDAVRLTYYGLYALQHRGQESAGIATTQGQGINIHKGMGLVSEVFDEAALKDQEGTAALGHVRYSTTGSSVVVNAQPLVIRYRKGALALAHNGNLVNARQIRDKLEKEGSIFQTTLDTEVLAHLIARYGQGDLEEALSGSLKVLKGGYAFGILTEKVLIGIRDPHGIRPLSLGKLGNSWVLASETCAFDTVGAETARDVNPGEMVVIDDNGVRSIQAVKPGRRVFCIFEYIYFARPDSNLDGLNVHAVRKEMGRQLAREAPADADLVTGVPDSSLSAASGFAEEAGIPYEIGLVKNRYVGRTFIQPDQKLRALGVRLKLNALEKVVRGKRVVLVDDSIVRGTTSRHIVQLLREAGAQEVHVRISSPPYRYSCYYGIDTSASAELIAAQKGITDIERLVGADSLAYLSTEGLVRAIGRGKADYCLACFNGDYAIDVSADAGKFALETSRLRS